jgi:glycosyltransferase involved in cell wall biosynthesis
MVDPIKILFYDDAADFGGHELMTLAAVRHAVAQPNVGVGFMFFRGNARLAEKITDLAAQYPGFKPLPQDYASRQFQFFRTLVSGRAIRHIASMITGYAPDVIVVAQGAIAFCSAGLMAGKRLGIPTLSYIPMTHPERLFSASRFRAALREVVNRIYYRLPDEYITVSPRMEKYLRQKGLRQPVTVVQAAIDLTALRLADRSQSRAKLGLKDTDQVVALIGRVQFWQKRQDLAVKGLALALKKIIQLKLLVVGDGPDLAKLKELVRVEGLEDAVVFLAWTDDLSAIYSAIDALIIPSRYEGVPLVMLHAMYFRRPVIAAAVDGMADTLPPHWLFPSGNAAALGERLVEVLRATEPALLDHHHDLVLETHSLSAFESAFMAAVSAAVKRHRVSASGALAS